VEAGLTLAGFDARAISILLVAAAGMLACGHNHRTDAELEEAFHDHYPDLVTLAAMLQQEPDVIAVAETFVSTDYASFLVRGGKFADISSRPPMTAQKLARYLELCKKIGMEGPVFKRTNSIEFVYDASSMSNGDTQKGFLRSTRAMSPLAASLDDLSKPPQFGPGPYKVYKPLATGWYLYLIIN
jgi:hypothetical protein